MQQHPRSTRLQLIMAMFLAVIEVFQIMKRYELVCRRRDRHEPLKEDVDEFMNCNMGTKNTTCIDCGCALQLELDDEDPTFFWVKEI